MDGTSASAGQSSTEIELVREVQAVPVLAEEPRGRGLMRATLQAKQAMVLAAGGFVAGAAIVGLAGRRRARRVRGQKARRAHAPARVRRRGGKQSRAGELVQIVGTRSLLLDVHLLDRR